MPLFSLHSAFDEVVEAATPSMVPENDAAVIAKFLPVADKINASAPGSSHGVSFLSRWRDPRLHSGFDSRKYCGGVT